MNYELVNLITGDRIGDYDAEAPLLDDVRYLVRLRGPAALAGVGFAQVDAQGRRKLLAAGRKLLELAAGAAPVAVAWSPP
jgi:hypothetical protein